MPDDDGKIEWERVAALIEACRLEREACACVRDKMVGNELLSGASVGAIASATKVSVRGPLANLPDR